MATRNPKNYLLHGISLSALVAAGVGTAQAAGNLSTLKPPAQQLQTTGNLIMAGPRANAFQIYYPPSNIEKKGFVHTNVKIALPPGGFKPTVVPDTGPPQAGHLFETPASIACAYRLVPVASGCNPNIVTTVPSGGSKAIAIVDAYDYPAALSDLKVAISQFGLALANLQVVYGTGNPASGCVNGPQPPNVGTSGWDVEAALDLQIVHAMAPAAKIYFVEAASNSFTDMFNAVSVATKCVQASGGGEQSNSWGGAEFSGETSYNSVFTGAGVAYFASTGDTPGVEYPSASPNVFGVGGTTFSRNQTTGAFQSEAVWNSAYTSVGTGGGYSAYETRPSYQNGIAGIVGGQRGVPDLAALADPETGFWIYNSISIGGWAPYGGTSLATPLVTGIVNRGGFFWSSSFAGLTNIYNLASAGTLKNYVTDINSGLCGAGGSAGGTGQGDDPQFIETATSIAWDPCTGWGTPHGNH